jgi:hypothetical protein
VNKIVAWVNERIHPFIFHRHLLSIVFRSVTISKRSVKLYLSVSNDNTGCAQCQARVY